MNKLNYIRKKIIYLKRRFKRLSKVDRYILTLDFLVMTSNLLTYIITLNTQYFFIVWWIGIFMSTHIYYQKRIRLYSIGYYYAGKIIGMNAAFKNHQNKNSNKIFMS